MDVVSGPGNFSWEVGNYVLLHKFPSLTLSLDIWHKAKRLRKALAEVRLEMDFILIGLSVSG